MGRGSLVFTLAFGCGRIGFDVCAGCDGTSASISKVQVQSPGARGIAAYDVPLQQTKGDLLLAALYDPDNAGVIDSAGSTWMSLPAENLACGGYVRLWYALATTTGLNTISAGSGTTEMRGMFVVEYAGVSPTQPVEASGGAFGKVESATYDAGQIDVTDGELLVAAFVDRGNGNAMGHGPGFRALAHDDVYSAFVEDISVEPGTFTPTALPVSGQTGTCWLATSAVLRPE